MCEFQTIASIASSRIDDARKKHLKYLIFWDTFLVFEFKTHDTSELWSSLIWH